MAEQTDLSNIKAISLDGDMTLWDFNKVMRHSLRFALDELRRQVPGGASDALTIHRMIRIRNGVAAQLRGSTTNLEEIRLQAFIRTVESVGGKDDALAARLNSLYLQHRFEDIELYPDAIPALDLLAPRYRLGLLSNGNSYPERCGLQGYFSFVVFSQDTGHEKPDSRMFQVACNRAGCRPRELLHVGDSLESDVEGANSFGACAVWLNRYATANETAIRPALEISSLEQLPRLLCSEP